MSESSSNPIRLLFVGLDPKAAEFVEHACQDSKVTRIDSAEKFAEEFEQWNDDSFDAIFGGASVDGMSSHELAQTLLAQCTETFKCYIATSPKGYEPRLLIKNGFTAAYLLPTDGPLLVQAINEKVISVARKTRAMRTVRITDLGAGDELEFETFIYMPLNKKYVRYTAAGRPVESNKIEKLQARQMSQLHIDHRDMNKFYKYSAKKLRELGAGELSSTERAEKLKESVRGLFSDMFDQSVKADFEQGREVIKQVSGIISNYVTNGKSSNWYGKLMASIENAGDTYSHASSTSTFAALFAMGIGHKNPENLAMAGLFHDIGLTALPEELHNRRVEDMTREEQALYYTHPEKSMEAIKNKRIVVPEAVEKAILQHHEAYSGRGFPKGYVGNRVFEDAQILSLADQFEYLTRIEEGKERVTPLQALDRIESTGSINPDLLAKVRTLMVKEGESAKSA